MTENDELIGMINSAGLYAIRGTIGGWNIEEQKLESEVAMILSYEGTNHGNRATMNNASFKIWVGDEELCYLGRGGYNNRGSSSAGLFFVSGPANNTGVEIDGSTGKVNAQGEIEAGGNIVSHGNVYGDNISNMSSQISGLQGSVSSLDSRINSLSSSISSLSSAISGLDSRVTALENAS